LAPTEKKQPPHLLYSTALRPPGRYPKTGGETHLKTAKTHPKLNPVSVSCSCLWKANRNSTSRLFSYGFKRCSL